MGVLLIILGILFATLFILIPLLEKYGRERSPEELRKISRLMLPLMIILIIATAVRYFIS
jgi:Mn2+/Fe2+ NRAMP family transporter